MWRCPRHSPARDPSAHLEASPVESSRAPGTLGTGGIHPGGDSGVPRECWAPGCWAPCCDLASRAINARGHALLYLSCCTPLPGEKAREQTCARRSSRRSPRLLRFHHDKHRRGALRGSAGRCSSLLALGPDLVFLGGFAVGPGPAICRIAPREGRAGVSPTHGTGWGLLLRLPLGS